MRPCDARFAAWRMEGMLPKGTLVSSRWTFASAPRPHVKAHKTSAPVDPLVRHDGRVFVVLELEVLRGFASAGVRPARSSISR